VYGGSKARKLALLVSEVERRGARRILTFGAAGSHHVLATALFAEGRGLDAAALLTSQPGTPHVVQTLRASFERATIIPVGSLARMPIAFLRARRDRDYVLPPGGSNALGASAYVDAVVELQAQIEAGLLPEPDLIVVPLGSGGTCAGLLGGIVELGLRTRVRGVLVATNPLARPMVVRLARRTLEERGFRTSSAELSARLDIDASQIGSGYGHATRAAQTALDRAREALGLVLDLTYTAKAFASVLDLLAPRADDRVRHVLYWHTLSTAPVEPLLHGARPFDDLPADVRALVR
jgi:1-aminocyclopropane-1-carboxylate deaminase/D-cysteine desulfhydrase-like pyridoxal-dependent ACC family enzyme